MKKLFSVLLVFSFLIGFYSCTDKETGEPTKFSKLTPEEHKTEIANIGTEMITDMEDLAMSPAAEAAVNVVTMMDLVEDEDEWDYKAAALHSLKVLSDYAQNKATVFDVMLSVRPLKAAKSSTPMEEMYEDEAGTMEWDADNQEWDFEEGDDLVIKFPATLDEDDNNAVFSVTEFDWIELTDPASEEMEEMPVAIAANLTIDGKEEMSVSFTASYNAKGVPESIDGSIKISDYEFYVELENNDKKATIEYGTKKGDKQLTKVSAGVNGDLSESNIDANTRTVEGEEYCVDGYYDEDYNWVCSDWETDEWEEVDIENILEKGYGFIEVLNLRVGGEILVEKFVPELDAIYPEDYWDDEDFDYKAASEKEAAAMNEYISFYAAYVDDNKKIADVEFYSAEGEDCYEDWEGDEVCDEYYYVGGRFVFGDDSKVDVVTYFEDGFDAVFDAIEDFVDEMNEQYEDYGIEIPDPDLD